MKARPIDVTEDELRLASEGRSEEVLGKKGPVQLSEEEVKTASEGRSEAVLKEKLEGKGKAKGKTQ
jgi:hypothetical protein